MHRIVRLPLLTLIALLVSGCQAVATPAPSVPHVIGPASKAASSSHPASTAAAVPQPTPASGQGIEVDIALTDNKINSTLTTFRVGETYTFAVRNSGTHPRCFDLAQPVSSTGSLGASQGTALVSISQTDLPVGSVVKAKYTFTDADAGVRLEFSCLLKRPYGNNMRLPITVTK